MEVRPGYKQTEVGVIPTDWDAVQLGKIGQFKNGINKDSEAFGHGSPFVNLMDVFGVSSINSNDSFGLIKTSAAEKKNYDLKRGDVMFIRSSVKPSGVGLTAVVETDLPGTVYSGFLIRLRDKDALDIGFKRHCFYSENFRSKLIGASSVSANTNINQDNLRKLVIALPPNATEQCAIGTALSDVDALLAKLDALIAKKRDLKQATMQQLLTGQTRLPGFSGEWLHTNIGSKIDLLTGFPFPSSQYVESGVRLLRGSNVKRGETDWHEDLVQFWPAVSQEIKRYELEVDDLVIAMDGSLVGRSFARLTSADLPAVLLQRVARIRSKAIDIGFLTQIVGSKYFIQYCDSVKTVTAIPHISASDIRNFEVLLPPSIDEQAAIANALSDMDAELTALEARRDKTRALKQGMMQELLTGRIRLV